MPGQPTILLVEDDPGTRGLFEAAVDESEIGELAVATDGREALTILPDRNDGRCRLPDLIVLDLDLPDVHGLEVLGEFKAHNSPVRLVPTLILSDDDDQTVVDEAYETGANAYLSKPDGYGDLLEMVASIGEFWLTLVRLPTR